VSGKVVVTMGQTMGVAHFISDATPFLDLCAMEAC
jgi:hypothetical protein